jgi:hypothetical protein
VILWRAEYLPWRQQFAQDLVVSAMLCFGEKAAERILLPGLHRMTARTITDDPARIDSFSIYVGEAVALFGLLWVFYLTLYAISYLTKRPLKSYAPSLVGGLLIVFVFVSSLSAWFQMPNPPPPG